MGEEKLVVLIQESVKLELRVPDDRGGRFSTELFERYQRSEQALVATLAEIYVQGVSTRKVKAITEELCGHAFSGSVISAINKRVDESLEALARRALFSWLRKAQHGTRTRLAGDIDLHLVAGRGIVAAIAAVGKPQQKLALGA
jgi:hypothetical protein